MSHHPEPPGSAEWLETTSDPIVDPKIVTWLVDTGYGSDYTLKEPIPKSYRWPLARRVLAANNPRRQGLHPGGITKALVCPPGTGPRLGDLR